MEIEKTRNNWNKKYLDVVKDLEALLVTPTSKNLKERLCKKYGIEL